MNEVFAITCSSQVLWLHTLFTLLYLAIAGAFMIHFSIQLGKHQLDHVSLANTTCSAVFFICGRNAGARYMHVQCTCVHTCTVYM